MILPSFLSKFLTVWGGERKINRERKLAIKNLRWDEVDRLREKDGMKECVEGRKRWNSMKSEETINGKMY